mgnify:CR=1 FL=1
MKIESINLCVYFCLIKQILMDKLYQAAQSGNLNLIKISLKRTININMPNSQNWTLLHFACFGRQQEIVQFLIDKQANLNARTSDGVTPLHLAAQVGNEFLIAILIEAGAIVDSRDVFILYFQCLTFF